MERTMLNAVSASGNLLALIQAEGSASMKHIVQNSFGDGFPMREPDQGAACGRQRGVAPELMDLLRAQLGTINLLDWEVTACPVYNMGGNTYSTHKNSPGHAHVCFVKNEAERYGRILEIILCCRESATLAYAVITPFAPLVAERDPFEPWQDVAGRLFHASPEPSQIVHFDAVKSHASFQEYNGLPGRELVHLMALNKVRSPGKRTLLLTCRRQDFLAAEGDAVAAGGA